MLFGTHIMLLRGVICVLIASNNFNDSYFCRKVDDGGKITFDKEYRATKGKLTYTNNKTPGLGKKPSALATPSEASQWRNRTYLEPQGYQVQSEKLG